MFRIFLLVLFLSGCASANLSLSVDQVQQLRGKSITVVDGHKLPFEAHTAQGAVAANTFMTTSAGMVSINFDSSKMYETGAQIVKHFSVDDPSEYVKNQLVDFMATKHGLKPVSNKGLVPDNFSTAALSDLYNHADYIVDVRTTDAGFMHYGTSWSQYRVRYSAEMALIDTSSKSVIASKYCLNYLKKTDGSPTMDQLLKNNANLLKRKQKELAEVCLNQFKTALLGQ